MSVNSGPPLPVLGDPSKWMQITRRDAVVTMQIAMPTVGPELKAIVYGAGSSPGVAEGFARVISSPDESHLV